MPSIRGIRCDRNSSQKARHDDLFRARLDQIINMRHELVVPWPQDRLDLARRGSWRGAFPTRAGRRSRCAFMIGMFPAETHLWALRRAGLGPLGAGPLFPVLHRRGVLPARTGPRTLRHEPLAQRIGDKLDILLAESLRVAHATGALAASATWPGSRSTPRCSPRT